MTKAFERIAMFSCETHTSEEHLNNTISAWLNRIAANQFIDLLRNRSRNKTFELDDADNEIASDCSLPSDFEFASRQNQELLLQRAWDELNEREKLIIYLCIKHNCLNNKKHLPDSAIELICKTFDVEKSSIRQIKLRALKKIRHNP